MSDTAMSIALQRALFRSHVLKAIAHDHWGASKITDQDEGEIVLAFELRVSVQNTAWRVLAYHGAPARCNHQWHYTTKEGKPIKCVNCAMPFADHKDAQ